MSQLGEQGDSHLIVSSLYACVSVCVCECVSASTSALPADWISDNVRTYFVRVAILCLRASQFLPLPVLCVP